MTTDPSIEREEAAGDAADLWTHQQGYAMTGTEWGAFEQGYLAGSAWARARLTAQEPTDAEVEVAAIECVKFLFLTAPERPWEDPEVVEQWEPMARIALRATRRDEEKP